MVFGAQNPSRIVDLNHIVVLIGSTIIVNIDRMRVFVDDLWGLISDLWIMVGRRHELRKRIIERTGALNLAIISLAASLRNDRSHSGCSRQTLYIKARTPSSYCSPQTYSNSAED